MMKKTTTLIALSMLVASTASFANVGFSGPSQGSSGFSGPSQGGTTTVAAAKSAWDDTQVVLTGNIKSNLGGEYYLFEDSTGTITVEIDYDKWFGVSATPDTRVTIYGEVDKETFREARIDVDYITLAK